jgi:hypothetical protein
MRMVEFPLSAPFLASADVALEAGRLPSSGRPREAANARETGGRRKLTGPPLARGAGRAHTTLLSHHHCRLLPSRGQLNMSSTTFPSLPPFNTIALQQPLTLAGSGLPSTTDGSGDRPLPALGPLVLANRVILASLTRNRAGPADEASRETTDGVPNPEMIEYYRQRARGGFGLLLSEGVLIEPQVRSPRLPRRSSG